MKIIDVSIFCAEYEKELCLLKLILEGGCVDEFVWVENCYTYRGDYKGPILEKMIASDPRFEEYKARIKIITISEDFSRGNTNLRNHRDPVEFHKAEEALRLAPTSYIIDTYGDDDRIIVSDIDEMVDFSCSKRRNKIFVAFDLYNNQPLQFERKRYIWDFDISAIREQGDIITPSYTVHNLKSSTANLSQKKWNGIFIPNGNNITIFEYCSCFTYQGVRKKFNSSLHTLLSDEELDVAIKTATWEMRNGAKPHPQNRYHWFDRVELTESNSPQYVRENLATLKTNLVPYNYKEYRLQYFGVNPIF